MIGTPFTKITRIKNGHAFIGDIYVGKVVCYENDDTAVSVAVVGEQGVFVFDAPDADARPS